MVYATANSLGVVVIDISDPANPYIHKVIECDTLMSVGPVMIVDTFLYIRRSGYFGGIYVKDWDVYNISNPLEPLFIKNIWHYEGTAGKAPMDWWGRGDWAQDSVIYGTGCYKSFNFKDPLNPTLISYITGGADQNSFLYPYIYTCGSYAVGGTFPFMIYDVSDPENMFKVSETWYWAPYDNAPTTIGAWELNGKRYVYTTGPGFSWSLDVTDPHNPVVLNFGDREIVTSGSVTHGLRFYGMGGNPYDFAVYSLEDPVHIPVVGWYKCDSILRTETGVWANGYVVATVYNYENGTSYYGIAIFQYAGDQVEEEPKPSPLSFLS